MNLSRPSTLDLNVDLGESDARQPSPAEEALLGAVSSVNLSCGLHAGNPCLLRALLTLAARRGIAVGAHPSYDDRAFFGRRETGLAADEIRDLVRDQLAALEALAHGTGAVVRYVKAHGALYHRTAGDPAAARVFAKTIRTRDPELWILGPPGSALAHCCHDLGLRFAAEGFLDRGYRADGTLVPRGEPGDGVDDPATAAARAVAWARGEAIVAADGSPLMLAVRSLGVHGDSAAAGALLAHVRARLAADGVAVGPFAS